MQRRSGPGLAGRVLLLLLMALPYFSVPYLVRTVWGVDRDGALLALLAYMTATGAENIVATRVSRVSPPTGFLLTLLTLDYIWGVWGALVTRSAGLTLLASLCVVWLLYSWFQGVRSIVERTWLIPRALSSGDPERVRLGSERQRFYQATDQALVDAGWVRGE